MYEIILNHLKKHGSITTWEAIENYGCTRLSQYILLIRKDGHMVDGETVKFVNRYGKKSHYTVYRLRP